MCYSVYFCLFKKRHVCFSISDWYQKIPIRYWYLYWKWIGASSILQFLYFAPSFCSSLCRNLRQPAVGHRDVLRHRPPLRVPLRLLEALLAAMAGQGGRRAEPDVGAAARDRRVGRGRGAVAFTPAVAEEGGPLLFLALPLAGAAGTPPLL